MITPAQDSAVRLARRRRATTGRAMSPTTGDPTGTLARRRLTSAERAERNRQIAEIHLSGATWDQVGKHFKISGRQAKRCAKEHAEAVSRLGSPPARGTVVEDGVDIGDVLALAVRA
jgi:hypothetical protein